MNANQYLLSKATRKTSKLYSLPSNSASAGAAGDPRMRIPMDERTPEQGVLGLSGSLNNPQVVIPEPPAGLITDYQIIPEYQDNPGHDIRVIPEVQVLIGEELEEQEEEEFIFEEGQFDQTVYEHAKTSVTTPMAASSDSRN